VKGYDDLIPLVGNLLDATVGSVLLAEGNWKADAKYGRQFMAEKWEETMPATLYGIEKYLGSGLMYTLNELALAYATTILKAQGSEYPIVVMPVLMTHYVMLQRNMLYTGITRAKKLLVLLGSRKALRYSVRNVTVTGRNTRLKERLTVEGKLSSGREWE